MKLYLLNAGSKDKIQPLYCCSSPWTFESWYREEDDVAQQPASSQDTPEPSGDGVCTAP